MALSIDSGLRWFKALQARHGELVSLRNDNSKENSRYFGDREVVVNKPVYDIKALDKVINNVAKEMRKLDEAIKATNAVTNIINYEKDESALGEIS